MYKVYYLTSDYDLGIPMYIGMTKLTLSKRLKEHLNHKRKTSKKELWKDERNKNITIHLIQAGISTFSECADIELYWIKYWKKKNPNLKNSLICKLSEHPHTNRIENIRRNISEGVIAKRCRDIVALDINQNFIQEYRTIIAASKDLKVKDEIISKNLRNLTKAKKYIFLYKDDYNPNIDYNCKVYNVKERKKRLDKPIVSENCRSAIRKPTVVINIKTNKVFSFSTQEEVSKFLNCSNALVSRYKREGKLFNNTFIFHNKDIVRSSEKSEKNKR